MSFSPVATGVLMGAISGAAMGFMYTGNPMGAAVGAVAGGVTGGIQADKAEDDRIEGLKNQKRAEVGAAKNQSALADAAMQDKYKKLNAARGLDTSGQATGMEASQTGAVLTSTSSTSANQNSLLG